LTLSLVHGWEPEGLVDLQALVPVGRIDLSPFAVELRRIQHRMGSAFALGGQNVQAIYFQRRPSGLGSLQGFLQVEMALVWGLGPGFQPHG